MDQAQWVRLACRPTKEAPLSEWMSVKEAAEYARKSQNHIRHLLRTGLVKGRKFGRDWFTTKEDLDEYLATDPRPGPKPKDSNLQL